jgi:hypothetical protein
MESKKTPVALPVAVCAPFAAGCTIQASVPSPPSRSIAERPYAAAARRAAAASFGYAGTLRIASKQSIDTYAVVQRIRASSGTYDGHPITEYDGAETETGKGKQSQTTFEASVAEIASWTRTGSDVTSVRFASSDSDGLSQSTRYAAGNGAFDQLPEVAQASWTNTAARTESVADSAMGSSAAGTYRADGSYDEVAMPGGRASSLAA